MVQSNGRLSVVLHCIVRASEMSFLQSEVSSLTSKKNNWIIIAQMQRVTVFHCISL